MIVHQSCATVGNLALAAHLSALQASHQQVESCLIALETIMANELSDLGHFSGVRLRLRQANLTRKHIALNASRDLMTIQQDQHSLRDLQGSELAVSQMISEHVQCWTMQALQNDWEGYCRATEKVLDGVRTLIAAEKKLLCPMLREGAHRHGAG